MGPRRHDEHAHEPDREHGDHRAFCFFDESDSAFFVQVDTDEIAKLYLIRRYEIRQRENQIPFNGALEMARTIFRICTFM